MAAAVVAWLGLVGPGFTWLASATTVLVGIWPALDGDSLVTAALVLALVAALVVRRNQRLAGGLLGAASVLFVVATASWAGWPLAITATLGLGGITGEMLLAHWYLVDPTLPRTVLRGLAVAGIVGMAADAIATAALLGLPSDPFLVGVLVTLAVTTIGMMIGVIGALRYPAYSGVMAATGLSYLAVLTGLAVVFFSRVLPTAAF